MLNKSTHDELKKRITELEKTIAVKDNKLALLTQQSKTIFSIQEVITKSLVRNESLHKLYSDIYKTLTKVLNIKNFFIALIDKKNEILKFPFFIDEKDKGLSITKVFDQENQTLSMKVIQKKESLFITKNEINKKKIVVVGSMPEAWIGVPLITNNEVIGVMAVQDYQDSAKFSDKDVKIMEAIADFIAVAVEMKLKEEVLNETKTKFKSILDQIAEGFYEVDMRGNVIDCNEALCDILEYNKDELIGMNNRDFIEKGEWNRIYNIYNEVYRTGAIHKGVEWVCITKKGKKKYLETSVVICTDKDGEPLSFRGLASDVTQKKEALAQKINLEKRMLTAKRMESIGTLAGGIAHNFNNLLMAIKGYSELIRLDLDEESRHYQMLLKIEKKVDSGASLTGKLLGYARGGMYEVKTIDLNALVRSTVSTFHMARNEISIEYNLSANLAGVKADFSQIEQVIMNLCVNSADAMHSGGVITVSTTNVLKENIAEIDETLESDEYVCLSIADTGHGIKKDTMDHIFEPFFTTKDISIGTGLGLSSVYGIIERHKGHINVKSEIDKGTEFLIYLPSEKAPEQKNSNKNKAAIPEKISILFVDDDEILQELGGEILKSLNYKPIIAKDGEEALEIYSKDHAKIKMVILDMILPHMSGAEIYNALKKINPEVKVLLSSGYSLNGQASKIISEGCDGFIQKPFNRKDLADKIKEILEEKKT